MPCKNYYRLAAIQVSQSLLLVLANIVILIDYYFLLYFFLIVSMSWWKLKAPKYPILARLTHNILAVPILTVASESTLSTTGRTLSPVRNSLNDESIESLICVQNWLRALVTGPFFFVTSINFII
jgi:hAT family C-terminal dimerisation region